MHDFKDALLFLNFLRPDYNNIFELEVFRNDGLPEYVCKDCFHTITEFLHLKTQVKEVESALMKMKRNENMVTIKEEIDIVENPLRDELISPMEAVELETSASSRDEEMIISSQKEKRHIEENSVKKEIEADGMIIAGHQNGYGLITELDIKNEIDIEETEIPTEQFEIQKITEHQMDESASLEHFNEMQIIPAGVEKSEMAEKEGRGHIFKYAIVEFIGEKTVQAVPTSWIITELTFAYCYWPKFNASRHVRRGSIPDEEKWSQYEVRIFTYADDYQTAVSLAKKAEETSNFEDGEEQPSRIRKKPQKYSDSSDSEVFDERIIKKRVKTNYKENPRITPPSMPKTPVFQQAFASGSDEPTAGDSRIPSSSFPSVSACTVSKWSTIASSNVLDASSTLVQSGPSVSNTGSQSCPRKGQEVGGVEGVLLKMMIKLDNVIENHTEQMSMLRMIVSHMRNNVDEVKDVLLAPVKSIEELNELCKMLEDEGYKKKMILFLSSLGGRDLRDCVRRMLRQVGHNRLWAKYSLKGRKGKLPLQDLAICKVIIRACQRSFKLATAVEIETAIAETMKHAPKLIRNN